MAMQGASLATMKIALLFPKYNRQKPELGGTYNLLTINDMRTQNKKQQRV
jgi:hypothetical protein